MSGVNSFQTEQPIFENLTAEAPTSQSTEVPTRDTLYNEIFSIQLPENIFPTLVEEKEHGAPNNASEVLVVPLPDRSYLQCGCADGYVRALAEDETFEGHMQVGNLGAKVPAGARVLAIKDIKPFGYDERIGGNSGSAEADRFLRNAAKLLMNRDFLALFKRAMEVDPNVNVVYGHTNAAMAKFKCEHWGFKVMGDISLVDDGAGGVTVTNTCEESIEDALARVEKSGEGIIVYATPADVEAKLTHLVGYMKDLRWRLEV